MMRFKESRLLIALGTLLLCLSVIATPTTLNNLQETEVEAYDGNNETEYKCPKYCSCVLHTNAHTKFLHAKCTQIDKLLDEIPLEPEYPIHSIDLSYLRLSRVSQIFSKLPNLTSINLSHNELHEVGHLGRRMKHLNLKHNRITSNKLSKLPENLQTLNLQHNDISYLPLDFKRLNQLTNLELSHNDINCSCETLEVRNWIQERQIFMENPVICAYPVAAKKKSWLQVKQSDVCESEKHGWNVDDDENELMAADQPMFVDNEELGEDELGKEYLPFDGKVVTAPSTKEELSDVEGSGDLSVPNMEDNSEAPVVLAQSLAIDDEEADDGSGSGGGMPFEPVVQLHSQNNDYVPGTVQAGHLDDDFDTQPMPAPEPDAKSSMEKNSLGIYDASNDVKSTETPPLIYDDIPVVHHHEEIPSNSGGTVVTDGPMTDGAREAEAIQHSNVGYKDDSNATYLLLGIVCLLVLGLLLFVGIKRCNNKNRTYDPEALRQTELLDMDKNALGKPLQRNGTEHSPLIGEKSKIDQAKPVNGSSKKPYDSNDVKDGSGQQLLTENGKKAPVTEALPESDVQPTEPHSHEYHPITPRYPTPKSPRASKYAQYPPSGENNNNTIHDDAYLPSSPKSGRYSPVYSPETGKVKIKLTETPRPKTPMLVTRSRSNAGDIITTPVHATATTNGGMH